VRLPLPREPLPWLQLWRLPWLRRHMIAGGGITAIAMPFESAIAAYPLPAHALVTLVDNNPCRLAAVQFARRDRVPAVFSMVSLDGMRVNTFLQEACVNSACLWCATPNRDPNSSAPCAAAINISCIAAAGYAVLFLLRGVLGWPDGVEPFNWRTTDLLGREPDSMGLVGRRERCRVCRKQAEAPKMK
jgi:hypothetical protein